MSSGRDMDRIELGNVGESLAEELEAHSNKYHVKSDKHEILAWEAVGVRGMAQQLLDLVKCTYELESSALFSSWGESLVFEEFELSEKVKLFRKKYAEFKNT
ncbi:hypothetical protein ACM9HF_04415 [Colwellia sp. RE-S-Sl-9]